MTSCETTPITVTTGGNLTQELTDGWQMDKKLGECMVQMFDARLWTDVTFRCPDQSEKNLDDRVHAHKIVLAARSPVFQVMFFGQWKDTCNNSTIEIQDAHSSHFKMFLRFLYSDSFEGKEDIIGLTQVLDLAHKYQVNFLVDKCCQQLEGKTTIDNVFLHLERALLYENAHFLEMVSKFIDENAEQILMTGGFLKMSLPCLTHILKGDTFYASEALIFNKAIEWARKRCESTDGLVLRKTLGGAFYFLRTPAMTLEDFTTCTMRKGYYTIEEYEDIILQSTKKTAIKQTHIACNFTKKRNPPKLYVDQPDVPNTYDKKKIISKDSLSEMVTITVNTDVHLTHIKLRNHSMVFHLYRDASVQFLLKDARLSVTLTKDNTCMGTYCFSSAFGSFSAFSDKPGSFIVALDNPILFSAGKSYTLEVAIALDVIQRDIQLQSPRRESENYFNFKNDFLSIITKGSTFSPDPAEVIRSFKFEFPSNRIATIQQRSKEIQKQK